VSAVVPVFGCADCLEALHARLAPALARAARGHEILFVDDASPDGAAAVLARIAAADPSVRILTHPRNFGQHPALATGAAAARGDLVAVLDGDLQDPPEVLERMIPLVRASGAVAAGDPTHARGGWRRPASRAWTRAAGWLRGRPLERARSTLSVAPRAAVEALLASPHRGRAWVLGFEALGIPVRAVPYGKGPRHAGRSAYGPLRLARVAWDAARVAAASRRPA
jgi:dolichol-phosphate mannosyltransferase